MTTDGCSSAGLNYPSTFCAQKKVGAWCKMAAEHSWKTGEHGELEKQGYRAERSRIVIRTCPMAKAETRVGYGASPCPSWPLFIDYSSDCLSA